MSIKLLTATLATLVAVTSSYGAVIYNNLTPNNLIGVATRPDITSFEIEAGDDFILNAPTLITGASFTGILVGGGAAPPSITDLVVEMYRVFPNDSNTVRIPNVPTRQNSPSDVAFDSRDSATAGDLTFSTSTVAATFTALNSVAPGGIHPSPGQTTGGNGPQTGIEVQINVNFTHPFLLPADHFFFVPQVQLSSGNFFWLSASRPISGAGTTPINPDLQAWTRDQFLDPDWLRVGMDIVGPPPTGGAAPTFNLAFSLDGTTVPEPDAVILMTGGLVLLALSRLKARA